MIELKSDRLVFSFPEIDKQINAQAQRWTDARYSRATREEHVHLPAIGAFLSRCEFAIPRVRAEISFQRTLRVPDDGKDYPLPPGLGRFPVCHVDDFAGVPDSWMQHGGVMLPMHTTEALWLQFSASYPMALKVGAGGVCAISGDTWSATLHSKPQNYVVLPEQPWLDGFRIGKGVIRQFVAVPLGKGLTVEHQIRGGESWGGIQLQVFPLSVGLFDFSTMESLMDSIWTELARPPKKDTRQSFARAMSMPSGEPMFSECIAEAGLGAGGRMRQEIYTDRRKSGDWNPTQTSRCFVHLCLADDWQRLTGMPPPHEPPTARDYARAGLPWFDYDGDRPGIEGQTALTNVQSIANLVGEKIGLSLPDNQSVSPSSIVRIKPRPSGVVREF